VAGLDAASFTKDGHRFDIGATLLMMPQVYERMYADRGKNMWEELDLVRMDPVYRLRYPDDSELLFSSGKMTGMKRQRPFTVSCVISTT
jgi:phytoene dehydrogenase-like protein